MQFTRKSKDGIFLPVRERRPPKMRGDIRLSGYIDWTLERQGKVIAGGQQSNLITDNGLDAFAATGDTFLTSFREEGVIGTGSTEPAVTDVALVNEVQAVTGSNYAFNPQVPAGGTQVVEITRSYAFTITADRNLTEWGLRPAGGLLSIRELFRDDSNNPIAISTLVNDLITIRHTTVYTFGPVGANVAATLEIQEYDRNGAAIGDPLGIPGWHSWYGYMSEGDDRARVWASTPFGSITGYDSNAMGYFTTPRTEAVFQGHIPSGERAIPTNPNISAEFQPYIDGTHRRVRSWLLPEDRFNVEMYGFMYYGYGYYGGSRPTGGFNFAFDGQTFTKAPTHTVGIDLEVSWARG